MGVINIIKRWMVTKKRKKNARFSWGQLVMSLILIAMVAIIGSFTAFGAQGYKYMADKNPDATWAPWALWRSGKLFYFWGDSFASYTSYKAYVNRYKELHPENMMEAEFWKICCLNDGQQFTRCKYAVEDFLDDYENQAENKWFKKVEEVDSSLKSMDMSKRYDHPWY